MSTNHITRIIPVIKVNNRNLNQDFYVKTLGMKSLLEEAALLSLGDQTKTEKLILEESPSMRSRRVKGPKKLSRLIIKVQEPKEIEALLAQKPECLKLYRGKVGYAFEALSPEGDRIMLRQRFLLLKKWQRCRYLKSRRILLGSASLMLSQWNSMFLMLKKRKPFIKRLRMLVIFWFLRRHLGQTCQ